VEKLDYKEDVYDLEVENHHNFLANDIIIHNCGEQPLPPNGVCNLGSLDISKFYKIYSDGGEIDYRLLEYAVRLSVNFLDRVISVNKFPTEDIEKWARENRPVGLGVMGIADWFLMAGIQYGSEQSKNELQILLSFIRNIAYDESRELGNKLGIPEKCKFLQDKRRNITLLTIAPTGSISLLAGCSNGIEPIFSEITYRNDKTGSYAIPHIYSNKDYFKCAVASNGAKEVTWEEHIEIQNASQVIVDSAVSKTINFPNSSTIEDIYDAFIYAWRLGQVKGITVYRNGSRKLEVLSPKDRQKDICPDCGKNLIKESGCKHCESCEYSVCEIG